MAKIISIPLMQGADPEKQTVIGHLRIRASDTQASQLYLGVVLPNYEPQEDGTRKVTSYSLVPRAQVLRPDHLRNLATMEARGDAYYEQRSESGRDTAGDTTSKPEDSTSEE